MISFKPSNSGSCSVGDVMFLSLVERFERGTLVSWREVHPEPLETNMGRLPVYRGSAGTTGTIERTAEGLVRVTGPGTAEVVSDEEEEAILLGLGYRLQGRLLVRQ
jgi:hypothetical protein